MASLTCSRYARRFADRHVTTNQILLFGLVGGLILGVVLVTCFSIGLAVTMVSSGVIASLSMKQLQKR